MSDLREANGSCLCGKVHIFSKTMNIHASACHCGMCRKWAGGPLMVVDCGMEVSFSGEEHINVYSSSEWAERGFCAHCGSHLFYRLKEHKLHFIPVGLFENLDDIIFDHQVFIDDKPKYYDFANKTKNMTGEEVFASFSESE